ncbi:MAG: type II secretion system protein [Phycisphaerae bacterium]|nr:type II secretion system protein [Phycisphaerae bacterium]
MNTIHRHRLARRQPARAFTLVELMVVIGIISLLIAIALPAFSAARTAAKRASTEAMISTLSTGADMFHADSALGGAYPPSVRTFVQPNPINNSKIAVCGANLLVWGLAGADLLGTPGFRDLDNSGTNDIFGGWTNDMGSNPAQPRVNLYALSGTKPYHPRSGPYVDLSKVRLTKQMAPNSLDFQVPAGGGFLNSHAFLDAWDQPILYYKANPNAKYIADEGSVNEGRSAVEYYAPGGRYAPSGIYNLFDNAIITTDPGMDFGAGRAHFSPDRNATNPRPMLGNPTVSPTNSAFESQNPPGSFVRHIFNPSISAVATPHRPDSFILLSAGADGLFGTADDVANFPINK